ncbi:hypothetical protein RO07_14710 [Pandoraea pulmonicola]|uniref:Uncharacterized protein n=2 Tax=Pandoraea pulmonicola TaxID=93221 RepID=A0AAJ4ZAH5_PANPU|nr:hypothetical protein RO07_14710 [Pandoraea pulmonicola]SUA89823.1 Uncharacterised protein [Pandoraea pulmonicola]
MTLRGGNPQALMLPAECLHHYHVDVQADAGADRDPGPGNVGRLGRIGQWLRSLRSQVRRTKTVG